MAFNISCSSDVKTCQILRGKPHMLQILCSSVRVKMAASCLLNFVFELSIFFFIIHSSALKLCIYRSSVSASLLVLSVFMWDRKRGHGGHINFVNPPYAASFGYYANMVQQIEFIIYTNVQSQFVCEVTHEYGDDLIRFSVVHWGTIIKMVARWELNFLFNPNFNFFTIHSTVL